MFTQDQLEKAVEIYSKKLKENGIVTDRQLGSILRSLGLNVNDAEAEMLLKRNLQAQAEELKDETRKLEAQVEEMEDERRKLEAEAEEMEDERRKLEAEAEELKEENRKAEEALLNSEIELEATKKELEAVMEALRQRYHLQKAGLGLGNANPC